MFFIKMNRTFVTLTLLMLLKIISSTFGNVYETDLDQIHYTVFRDVKVKWIDAFKNCLAVGAHLLSIDTTTELQFLKNFFNNSGIPNMHKEMFWTSASDIYDENNFIWMSDGKKIIAEMWAPNQPDNHANSEHCVSLCEQHGFRLNDDKCSNQMYYICERMNNSQLLTLQPNNPNINEQIRNDTAEKPVHAESLQFKIMELDSENYYLGKILAVLIIIAIAAITTTAITVKGEIHNILTAKERKRGSTRRLKEQDSLYEQNI